MTVPVRHAIASMSGASDASSLIYACRKASETSQRLQLGLANTSRVYPNGAVPMAVTLQYFKRQGLQISTGEVCEEVARTSFLNPRQASAAELRRSPIKNVIWRYSDETEAEALSSSFIDFLTDNIRCEYGVLDSLNWCLYEVMDNVFQHSHAQVGYAMLQLHYQRKRVAVAVSDDGIGILGSLREGSISGVTNEYDAIKLAVQERVTSKPKNMGNGLYGLLRVVGLNDGEIEIRSGRGYMTFKNSELFGDYKPSRPLLDPDTNRGTTVDWQLDVSRQVTLSQALGIERPNFRLESIEDDAGDHRVSVADFEEGLGTRRSAEQIRIRLENLLNEGAPRIVLDFSNINVISSSFADEVLGKLALQMGLDEFINRFRLDRMSETVEGIISRAIEQRISEGDSTYPGSARS